MGGGVAQLASYGVADEYLTGTPTITFYKAVYRRHTLFAMESIEGTFDGTADFGRKCTCQISRNGDLVGAVWLEITLPDLLAYDITPAPEAGNSVDVTSAAQGLLKDPAGNYWERSATVDNTLVYAGPVAFYNAAAGTYHASAAFTATLSGTATTLAAHAYKAVSGAPVYQGYSTAGSATSATVTYGAVLDTWPYLTRTANQAYNASAAVLDPPATVARYAYSPATKVRWANSIAHALLASVEIEVGGSRIDKHYGEWLDIWSELTEKEEKRAGFWDMVGKYGDADYDAGWTRAQSRERTYYLPLKFCFNTNPGLYLPLVALSYHQIKYNFEFREYLDCVKAAAPISQLTAKEGGAVLSMKRCRIFADYVFLDAPERIRMAEIPHEYLITQLQFTGDEAVPAPSDPNGTRSRKYSLNYNHPVRELVWVYVAKSNYERNAATGNNWFRYGLPADEEAEVFDEARLVINGHDRFSPRSAPYFRLVQPYEHHTRCPTKKVHCYSFSLLSPEDFQPAGAANFSRFDVAQLHFSLNQNLPVGRMKIYAYSFNVLRIANGLSGLAFSN